MSVMSGRGRQAADEGQHVADPGQERHHRDEREAARHDEPAHRVEPHGPQGVDLLRHLHRGDLRGEAGARSAGHDDRRDQRPELAELRDDDELGDVGDRAEAPELRDAENPMMTPTSRLAAPVTSSASAPIS